MGSNPIECLSIPDCTFTQYANCNWGEPERAPHRLVVDVGGMSVTCLTIYATYTVVGWWYERRMPDNLHYIHGVWLVVRPTIYFTNTEATVSWTSNQGVELMASNEDSLRRRRERDRLRRQTETAREREARSAILGFIYLCYLLSLKLLNRLARRR